MRGALDRLAVRASLVSVVHLVSMVGVIALVSWATFEPSTESGIVRHAELCVINMITLLDSPAAMKEEADSLAGADIKFSVYSDAGRLVSANVEPALAALPQDEVRKLNATKSQPVRSQGRTVLARAFKLPGGSTGYVLFSPPEDPPPLQPLLPGLLLALVASTVGAVLLARTFARPLTHLSTAAHKLGAGDLNVRVRLARRDEFGQLADAFDDMAERISRLVRTQQELLANVSHELRTPLARIQVALDIASEGDAATVQESLKDITEDLAELERLVADVLQTARLDLAAGRAGPPLPMVRRTQVDIPAMLDKVAARVRSAHRQGPFELEVSGELPALTGDPVLLRRVLDNLLDNANKYSDAGTRVRLDVRATESRIEFTVSDQGIGISAEDLPHITTPFFRTDRSRARRTGGLGLGLSLARRIVEAHAGTMTIESEVGVGTRVCVSLPASRETQVHVPAATHSVAAAQ